VLTADNLTTSICRLSWNMGASTSWNPLGLSRPLMGLLYFFILNIFEEILVLTAVFLKTQAILPNDDEKPRKTWIFRSNLHFLYSLAQEVGKWVIFLRKKNIDVWISVISCNIQAERTLSALTGSSIMSVVRIIT